MTPVEEPGAEQPEAGEPESAPRPPAPGPPYTCDLCGYPMLERHCKIACPQCGYLRDCSDP